MSLLLHPVCWWSRTGRIRLQSVPGNRYDGHRFVPTVESLEGRLVPASTIIGAFGVGAGGGPLVTVRFDDGGQFTFYAFDPAFRGGDSVTLGDVNGTGVPDVIVGAGPGGGPEVEVFDGSQLLKGNAVVTARFYAFDSSFEGGVTLAVGQVNGTSHDDVVVGAGSDDLAAIKVFDGAQLAQGNPVATASFLAFAPGSGFPPRTAWATLAVGPVNGTGHSDIVVGSGPGVASEVKVIDGAMLAQGKAVATADFMPYDPAFLGGVTVATADITGSGHDDVVVAPGPGGGPDVKVFDGTQLALGNAVARANFFAFDPAFVGGVSLAAGNINGTSSDDLIVGAGPGGGPQVEVFDGTDLATGQAVATASFYAFTTAFTGGVQVEVTSVSGNANDILNIVADHGGGPEVETFNGTQLAGGDMTPQASFFAFDPAFRGGVNLGFVFAASFLDPSYINLDPAGYQPGRYAPIPGVTDEVIGLQPTTYNFVRAPLSGTLQVAELGKSTYTHLNSGGSPLGANTGTGSLHANGSGSMGLGGKAQGGGLYLTPGQLTLANPLSTVPTAGGVHLGSNSANQDVTPGELEDVIEGAISWWDQAGIDRAQDQRLRDVHFDIANLGNTLLGQTTSGGVIHLSTTAAGYGWFVDTTGTESPPAGQMDLETVVAHEMGLVLGLKEGPLPGDIMNTTLAPGVRVMPTAHDVSEFGNPGG